MTSTVGCVHAQRWEIEVDGTIGEVHHVSSSALIQIALYQQGWHCRVHWAHHGAGRQHAQQRSHQASGAIAIHRHYITGLHAVAHQCRCDEGTAVIEFFVGEFAHRPPYRTALGALGYLRSKALEDRVLYRLHQRGSGIRPWGSVGECGLDQLTNTHVGLLGHQCKDRHLTADKDRHLTADERRPRCGPIATAHSQFHCTERAFPGVDAHDWNTGAALRRFALVPARPPDSLRSRSGCVMGRCRRVPLAEERSSGDNALVGKVAQLEANVEQRMPVAGSP